RLPRHRREVRADRLGRDARGAERLPGPADARDPHRQARAPRHRRARDGAGEARGGAAPHAAKGGHEARARSGRRAQDRQAREGLEAQGAGGDPGRPGPRDREEARRPAAGHTAAEEERARSAAPVHELSRLNPARKRFSMIREFHVADWFTLGNAACGTASVMSSMAALVTGDTGRLIAASSLIFAALVFDVLDGRIARWRQKASPLGRELDSLADVISFGVAPAA